MASSASSFSCFTSIICLLIFTLALLSPVMTTDFTSRSSTAEICGLEKFSVQNLTAPNIGWSYKYTFSGTGNTLCLDGSDTCEFVFAFCSQMNCSVFQNASACLINRNSSEAVLSEYKLGTYNTKNQFAPASNDISFIASFPDGENITNSQKEACNLSVSIEFDCNSKAMWPEPSREVLDFIPEAFLTHSAYDSNKCQYSFTFDYAGACPKVAPIPSDIEPGSEPLSTGTVFIIIFFVSIMAYFLLGMLIKCAIGKRGKEMIPHGEFWTMLPVYIADGCLFTCRCGRTEESTGAKYDSI